MSRLRVASKTSNVEMSSGRLLLASTPDFDPSGIWNGGSFAQTDAYTQIDITNAGSDTADPNTGACFVFDEVKGEPGQRDHFNAFFHLEIVDVTSAIDDLTIMFGLMSTTDPTTAGGMGMAPKYTATGANFTIDICGAGAGTWSTTAKPGANNVKHITNTFVQDKRGYPCFQIDGLSAAYASLAGNRDNTTLIQAGDNWYPFIAFGLANIGTGTAQVRFRAAVVTSPIYSLM